MRKVLDTLLSTPSLLLLTIAGGSFAVGSYTGDPAWLLGLAGSLGAWLMYLPWGLSRPQTGERPNRAAQANLYRSALDQTLPPQAVPQQAVREHITRREQLDRIFRLEQHIMAADANTPGGISVATPEVLIEVRDLANQAFELAMRRVGLLRALRSTSEARLVWEYNAIRERLQRVGETARDDLSALLTAKGQQIEAYRRLNDEVAITEAQLDSIETFLNTLSYDQSITVSNVNHQIERLKGQISARKEAAEEVRRIVAEAGALPPPRAGSGDASEQAPPRSASGG